MSLVDSPVYASDLIARYREGHSPVDELARILARISTYDRQVNCIAALNEAAAFKAAEASALRWKQGRPLGPLDGVPITVKDMLPVNGLPHRSGSLVSSPQPSSYSAAIVQRLMDAGAVMVALTTTAEFGGAAVTISPLTGVTRNAHDTSRTAGGSSGGAAVSVAAGFCAMALATDTGGSIRVPAALNGVVGYKPTGGRFDSEGGDIIRTMTCPGPIANSAHDCALLLSVLGIPLKPAPDPGAHRGIGISPGASGGALEGLSIVASRTLGYAGWLAPEVSNAFDRQIHILRASGAEVTEHEPDWLDPLDIFATHTRANYAALLRDLSCDQVALLGPQVREARQAGLAITHDALSLARHHRKEFSRQVAVLLGNFDLLLTPMTAMPAFDARLYAPDISDTTANPRSWTPFGYPFNLSGNPAITLPSSEASDGLPIGFQLVAKVGHDAFLLATACLIEGLLNNRSVAHA